MLSTHMLRSILRLGWDGLYCAAFPLFLLGTLALTDVVRLEWIARYDLVLVLCVLFQVGMLALKIETPREFATIFAFHAMGVSLEIFKVNHGGWAYPEEAWCKLAGVPMYSGFMYASVGSFLLAAFKRFEMRLVPSPPVPALAALVVLIYANFFTNTWLPDAKLPLLAVATWLLWRTWIHTRGLSAPVLLLFPAMGGMLWLAECWGTAFGSWQYPRQAEGWTIVPPDKLLSWTTLTLVSFLLVVLVRERRGARRESSRGEAPPRSSRPSRGSRGLLASRAPLPAPQARGGGPGSRARPRDRRWRP